MLPLFWLCPEETDVQIALTNPYQTCRAAFPSDNPEWDKPYSYLQKADDDTIAFEFLRRSPSYWQFFASLAAGDRMEWPAEIFIPFPSDNERSALQQFGIWKLCDPRRQLPPLWPRLWTTEASLSARYVDAIERADAENNFDYTFEDKPFSPKIRVDLLIDGPVDEQVDLVRWLLTRAQQACWTDPKKAPRPSRRLLPTYLALLDARCARVSFPEIAHRFGKGADAIDGIKKQFKAAAQLRDGGYRNLLLWGKVSRPAHLVVRDHPF
jgi:hypothetical protein